jgi:hypothetical protein
MQKIDAHIHFVADHPDSVQLLADLDLKLLNICVAHDNAVWRRDEAEPYEKLARQHPDRFAWCTSFDVPGPTTFASPPTMPTGHCWIGAGLCPRRRDCLQGVEKRRHGGEKGRTAPLFSWTIRCSSRYLIT